MPSRPKILLVDDDPSVRASLAFSMELEGFGIETFDCGEDLAARAELPESGCLILDYRLPGMDGLALLKSLRDRGIALPAVLITSAPSRSVRARAAEAGAAIVEKPLMCNALTSAVSAALISHAQAGVTMKSKHQGISEEALGDVVDLFYTRVRSDALIGPVFNDAIADWPEHLDKLQAFWSSVMLTSGRYKGRPLPAHVGHANRIDARSFERWLALWRQTTDELLDPASAAALQQKAGRIAESLALGIQFSRDPAGALGAPARAAAC